MALFINQAEDTNEILVGKVKAKIIGIKLNPNNPNTQITVRFQVMGGIDPAGSKLVGKTFLSNVAFAKDPSATYDFSWQIHSLRKAAGVPSVKGEKNVDIEAVLLNRGVSCELGIRNGKDGQEYQDVKYLARTNAPTQVPPVPATVAPANSTEAPAAVVTDDWDSLSASAPSDTGAEPLMSITDESEW